MQRNTDKIQKKYSWMCAIKPSPIQDLGSDRLLGGQLLVFYPSTDHETHLGEKKEQNIARIFSQTFLVSSFIERKAKPKKQNEANDM